MSLPVRERGLKPDNTIDVNNRDVAPRAGAWIETVVKRYLTRLIKVAPRAGAWIETDAICS